MCYKINQGKTNGEVEIKGKTKFNFLNKKLWLKNEVEIKKVDEKLWNEKSCC